MNPHAALITHAPGPNTVVALQERARWSLGRSGPSPARLPREVILERWRNARPRAVDVESLLTWVEDPDALEEIFRLDDRATVRQAVCAHPLTPLRLLERASAYNGSDSTKGAIHHLQSRLASLGFNDVLNLALSSESNHALVTAITHPHATDDGLLLLLESSADVERLTSVVALLITRRSDLAQRSSDLLLACAREPHALWTVTQALPDGHWLPLHVLRQTIADDAQPSEMFRALACVERAPHVFYDELVAHFRSHAIDPARTNLLNNSSCPTQYLDHAVVAPNTWPLVSRALAAAFGDNSALWLIAADLLPSFEGTVREFVECLTVLSP